MKTNWIIIGTVAIVAISLIFFLVKKNLKDKKELENFLNDNDFPIDKEEDELNNN